MSNSNYFKEEPEESYIDKAIDSTTKMCEYLSVSTKSFSPEYVYDQLAEHIENYGKLFYSTISSYVFACDDNRISIMMINIERMINKPSGKIEIDKTVRKIWDHVNLASCQARMLKESDDEFDKKFHQKTPELLSELDKRIDSTNAQLISLIAIFTALSFIVFGGLESLAGIMGDVTRNVMVSKLIAIASIWGIFMFNIIALFMFFVIKIISRTSTASSESKKGFISQFPVVTLGNMILIFVFLSSSVHYICIKEIKLFGLISYKFVSYIALGIMTVLIIIYFMLYKAKKKSVK